MNKSKTKKILFVINDFNVGGAELFVFRLGKELLLQDELFIMDLYPEKSNPDFRSKFEQAGFQMVSRFTLSSRQSFWLWKLNAIGDRIGFKGWYRKIERYLKKRHLQKKIKQMNPDVIHSHHFSSDVFVRDHFKNFFKKWVITMHGDYNESNYLNTPEPESFITHAERNLQAADAITYVADENAKLMRKLDQSTKKLKKINLGYDKKSNNQRDFVTKPNTFNFCMVARSNERKGWREAIEAFKIILHTHPQCRLFCVTPKEGIIEQLSEENKHIDQIIFTGYCATPESFISSADVCILPTYFESESTPYAIIEYLSFGRPVISTNIGDISYMLSTKNKGTGGILLELKEGKPDIQELATAMEELLINDTRRLELGVNASEAFVKFDMEQCVREYITVYGS